MSSAEEHQQYFSVSNRAPMMIKRQGRQRTSKRMAVASFALSAALMAAADTRLVAQPLVETLYLQGNVLPGADALPGFSTSDVVRSNGQRAIHVSENGNFVGAVSTDPTAPGPAGTPNGSGAGTFYLFGSTDGGRTPTSLLREAVRNGEEQFTFLSSGIDNAGNVSYASQVFNESGPPSLRSSLWENESLVFIDGDEIPAGPLAGNFFGSAGAVARSASGVTSWVTSYSDVAGGKAIGTALLRGTSTFEAVLKSGDVIPDLTTVPNDGGVISGNTEWSPLGLNYITEVGVPNGGTDNFGNPTYDDALVINGAAVNTASGAQIREDVAIPVADGGLEGETWGILALYDINDNGDYLVSAFTDGSGSDDTVVLLNGQIVLRENQLLDGVTLSGQPQGVAINEAGDIAIAWNDTLFINGQKIAGIGTQVDTDGDGVADTAIGGAGLSLDRLEITNQFAIGGGGLPVVYFAGEAGGGLDTVFRLLPADVSTLPGDYNEDSVVDAADYVVWRDHLGADAGALPNDISGGPIGIAQYHVWVDRFGERTPVAQSGALSAPEPVAATLLGVYLLVAFGCRKTITRSVT